MVMKQSQNNGTTKERPRPRKALSAYNYFFRLERARLLGIVLTDEQIRKTTRSDTTSTTTTTTVERRKHRKTPGMIGFRGMSLFVGKRWKSLSEKERIPYQILADQDKERFENEMKLWRRQQENTKIRNKDPAATSILSSSYSRHDIKQSHSFTTTSSILIHAASSSFSHTSKTTDGSIHQHYYNRLIGFDKKHFLSCFHAQISSGKEEEEKDAISHHLPLSTRIKTKCSLLFEPLSFQEMCAVSQEESFKQLKKFVTECNELQLILSRM